MANFHSFHFHGADWIEPIEISLNPAQISVIDKQVFEFVARRKFFMDHVSHFPPISAAAGLTAIAPKSQPI